MRLLLSAIASLSLLLAACGNDDGGAIGGEDTPADLDGVGGGESEDQPSEDQPSEGAAGDGATPGEGFDVQLTGVAEVPGPGDEEGTGDADLVLGEGEVCVEATVVLDEAPKAMHVHEGAETESGPVVVDFGPSTRDDGWSVCAEADQALIDDIAANPADFYLNVHNADFPDGAVRGQLDA